MKPHTSPIHLHATGALVALVGNPNCGKTALFNLLTGSKQKVANYAGVTVERKEGRLLLPSGKALRILDLPGTYSLYPRSMDERVTCNVLMGQAQGEKRPDLVVCVVDATNLRRNLRLVLAVKRLGLHCVVAVNMSDLAATRGIHIDLAALSQALGLPVINTVGINRNGDAPLREYLAQWHALKLAGVNMAGNEGLQPTTLDATLHATSDTISLTPPTRNNTQDHIAVQAILQQLHLDQVMPDITSDRIDRVVLHPIVGPALLAVVLFLIFQAVFSWATVPMDAIKQATSWVAEMVGAWITLPWLHSFVVDGLIAGLGGVVVFLPQILILFFFILLLEETGYLPRAAYLLDRIMGSVGLSGRSFIPLLSSFACAIPGIMATRTIANPRDRLITIMIAPLMTCSARLPVYALLIAAFIPNTTLWAGIELQGVVLFGLYLAGIVSAMAVAWLLKRSTNKRTLQSPLMMELPSYHAPRVRNIALGLWQRCKIFMRRVGGIILLLTIALWFLSSYPAPPSGATGAAIEYSFAGMIGHALAYVFEPIGFNWQISIALVLGMAAREVAVSALGTVYAVAASSDGVAQALGPILTHSWSIATALSMLAWFVFAPQCLSTLSAVKRETGGWKMPAIMMGYLFLLAYAASWVTYHCALSLGLG